MSKLILLGGAAGAGKSSLCSKLRETSGLIVLDKDRVIRPITEELLGALGQPASDRESQLYLTRLRPLEYQLLETIALHCLAAGDHVLVDAPWLQELTDPQWVENLRKRVQTRGGSLHSVWLTCDPDVNRDRLVERGAARDRGKLKDWPTYLSGPGRWLTEAPPAADLALDSTRQAPQYLARQCCRAFGLC